MTRTSRRAWLAVARRAPRPLLADDRRKVLRELNLRCRASDRGDLNYCALRLRAAVLLAADSGLRLRELCNLDAVQLIDDPDAPRWKLRSLAYLRPEQSKGRRVGPDTWDSSGTFLIGDEPRAALRALMAESKRRGYLAWPPKPGDPVFAAVRGNGQDNGNGEGRHRLSGRALQWQWQDFQRRAALASPYHFHCLRHDAMTRCARACNGNVLIVAAFGRCSIATAMRYCAQYLTAQAMLDLRNQIVFR